MTVVVKIFITVSLQRYLLLEFSNSFNIYYNTYLRKWTVLPTNKYGTNNYSFYKKLIFFWTKDKRVLVFLLESKHILWGFIDYQSIQIWKSISKKWNYIDIYI